MRTIFAYDHFFEEWSSVVPWGIWEIRLKYLETGISTTHKVFLTKIYTIQLRLTNFQSLKWRYFCFYSTCEDGWPLVGMLVLMTSSHLWRHFQNDATYCDGVKISFAKLLLVISSYLNSFVNLLTFNTFPISLFVAWLNHIKNNGSTIPCKYAIKSTICENTAPSSVLSYNPDSQTMLWTQYAFREP